MHSYAPDNYICPFCQLATGVDDLRVKSRQTDLVYQDDVVMAMICASQWPNNHGHVLVVPTEHYENIFDLPLSVATRIHELSREIALAMKAVYNCEGISTRQHNEPAGNQEVWHYHLHVYPRYQGDNLYSTEKGGVMDPAERAGYATRLRNYLQERMEMGEGMAQAAEG